MANDLMWDHHFCLTCDKQTDGPAYCSESCRLADYEGATSFAPPSGPGSPSWVPSGSSTYKWAMGAPTPRSRQLFSLSPAYDFGNAQPYYGAASSSTYSYNYTRQPAPPTTAVSSPRHVSSLPPTTTAATATTATTYHHVLSPSSSHSSLSSMRSGMSSAGGPNALVLGAGGAFANNGTGTMSSTSSQTSYGSSTASNSSDLSERVRSELRKYASSLEQGKLQRQLQRRRSC
ncbi:uncharacterized protein SPSK_01957 [Sporothrix schenckii 1099-18]|uniref:Life-span regulatory factor domain-containing protein n=2 Tax=Sporothrix schenckii TaxID=29908 RepID=U7PP64_SPOS1|nr:uncharacterized protein SPSK_01957 [Sporothrix schenckii 1099-18]ERS96300.1 hypothetical protein HMPREF1624_07209 [Sporothrix schenckii ATCC 58251]KJR87005.1 hypothetical protein SPSK_01957 [Sporothrix schenckii 1099-18]